MQHCWRIDPDLLLWFARAFSFLLRVSSSGPCCNSPDTAFRLGDISHTFLGAFIQLATYARHSFCQQSWPASASTFALSNSPTSRASPGSCSPSWPSALAAILRSLTVFSLIQPFSFLPPTPLTLPPYQAPPASLGKCIPPANDTPSCQSVCLPPAASRAPVLASALILWLFFSASAKMKEKKQSSKEGQEKSS